MKHMVYSNDRQRDILIKLIQHAMENLYQLTVDAIYEKRAFSASTVG